MGEGSLTADPNYMIKYHNASDATGNIININDVTPENRAAIQLFCLGCGAEMEAVLGEKREHHFRHKDKGDCNPETYLHRLAKRVLKYKFDTQTHFLVKYYVRNYCPKSSQCEFKERHQWQDCSSLVLKTVNLKEFYDTCEEEASHKGFRADLMLTHSEHPERSPVFLELSVTHDCTQEKIDSKIRIIEIKIQNETDAFREILENTNTSGVKVKTTKSFGDTIPPIRFYNFKRKDTPIHYLSRFYLLQSAERIYHGVCKPNAITCQNADSEHEKNACFEVTISEDRIPQKQYGNLYAFGIALAIKRGIGVKNCIFCAHYSQCVICHDSWENKPPYPEPVLVRNSIAVKRLSIFELENLCLAYRCSKYQFYKNTIRRTIDTFEYIPYWEWTKDEI